MSKLAPTQTSDLFRISKAKSVVDCCPNYLRKLFKQGLPFYKRGKAIFVSKIEFEQFIRAGKVVTA